MGYSQLDVDRKNKKSETVKYKQTTKKCKLTQNSGTHNSLQYFQLNVGSLTLRCRYGLLRYCVFRATHCKGVTECRERMAATVANEMQPKYIYLEWIRSFSLFAHILLTTVLYWTKFDSIQVTLLSNSNDRAFTIADESLTGLLSVSIIFLLLEVVFRAAEIYVTLWTVIHVFLDSCACFFITWIILDGLAWQTYVYVFIFCR